MVSLRYTSDLIQYGMLDCLATIRLYFMFEKRYHEYFLSGFKKYWVWYSCMIKINI